MGRKLKWVVVVLAFLIGSSSYPVAASSEVIDKCDFEYAYKQFGRILKYTPMNAKKKKMQANMRKEMKKLSISPENETAFIHDTGVYAYLSGNNCKIPDDFLERYFRYSEYESEPDSKICPKDTFLVEAEKELDAMKDKGEKGPYSFIESIAYSGIVKVFSKKPESLKLFEEKWENEVFRRRFMIAQTQVLHRTQSNCKIAHLPVKFIYDEINREAKWGPVE